MAIGRPIVLAVVAMLMGMRAAGAAKLPSQNKKPKPAETAKHCDVGGSPGVLAANGVCVRITGYISTGVNAGQVK